MRADDDFLQRVQRLGQVPGVHAVAFELLSGCPQLAASLPEPPYAGRRNHGCCRYHRPRWYRATHSNERCHPGDEGGKAEKEETSGDAHRCGAQNRLSSTPCGSLRLVRRRRHAARERDLIAGT
jgi:hypothetical protein